MEVQRTVKARSETWTLSGGRGEASEVGSGTMLKTVTATMTSSFKINKGCIKIWAIMIVYILVCESLPRFRVKTGIERLI